MNQWQRQSQHVHIHKKKGKTETEKMLQKAKAHLPENVHASFDRAAKVVNVSPAGLLFAVQQRALTGKDGRLQAEPGWLVYFLGGMSAITFLWFSLLAGSAWHAYHKNLSLSSQLILVFFFMAGAVSVALVCHYFFHSHSHAKKAVAAAHDARTK